MHALVAMQDPLLGLTQVGHPHDNSLQVCQLIPGTYWVFPNLVLSPNMYQHDSQPPLVSVLVDVTNLMSPGACQKDATIN